MGILPENCYPRGFELHECGKSFGGSEHPLWRIFLHSSVLFWLVIGGGYRGTKLSFPGPQPDTEQEVDNDNICNYYDGAWPWDDLGRGSGVHCHCHKKAKDVNCGAFSGDSTGYALFLAIDVFPLDFILETDEVYP